jgi:hypothetical protein
MNGKHSIEERRIKKLRAHIRFRTKQYTMVSRGDDFYRRNEIENALKRSWCSISLPRHCKLQKLIRLQSFEDGSFEKGDVW